MEQVSVSGTYMQPSPTAATFSLIDNRSPVPSQKDLTRAQTKVPLATHNTSIVIANNLLCTKHSSETPQGLYYLADIGFPRNCYRSFHLF